MVHVHSLPHARPRDFTWNPTALIIFQSLEGRIPRPQMKSMLGNVQMCVVVHVSAGSAPHLGLWKLVRRYEDECYNRGSTCRVKTFLNDGVP